MQAVHAQTDYFIGAEIGGYRIVSKLGEGAMGAVYQGEHSLLGRRVAIKFLNHELANVPELVARFFTEARSVNAICHPNIVDITDFGQRGDRYYYVMELLEGQTLQQRLDLEGRMDAKATIAVGAQIAAALAAAHDKGVVHRDLKPDNVFLCDHPDYPDYVKVFDFGIAKLTQEHTETTGARTTAGALLGTPLYMSPEQCLAQGNLDHRSDIYSLGVLMYHMLAGVPPFIKESVQEIIMGHIHEAPQPLRDHNDQITPELEACIMQALEKTPGARHADMRAFRTCMTAATPEEVEIPTDPTRAPKPRKKSQSSEPSVGEAEQLVGQLKKIILERIETDRLVLPAMPQSALAALKELDQPNVTFGGVSSILRDDPVLAPQLFRRASSAVFGNAPPPRTIEQAISRLGLKQLKAVLVELSAHKVYDSRNRRIRKAFKGIWDHTISVAVASRLVAQQLGDVDVEAAHLAGLMHDVGKPVVATLLLEAEKMLGMAKKDWLSEESWTEVIQESHREVGASIAREWQLPDVVIQVIEGCATYSSEAADKCANVVRFCNAFAKYSGRGCGPYNEEEVEEIVAEGVDLLGLDWIFVHQELKAAVLQAGKEAPPEASRTQALD